MIKTYSHKLKDYLYLNLKNEYGDANLDFNLGDETFLENAIKEILELAGYSIRIKKIY